VKLKLMKCARAGNRAGLFCARVAAAEGWVGAAQGDSRKLGAERA
jgi:hypothetical protein